jgi:type I restriction enzyme M protein
MVRVSKMNMIMHGDGHSGIFQTNGILTDPDVPEQLLEYIKDGTVDIIFSNPPFAGRFQEPAILAKFAMSKNEKDNPVTVSKEVLFVEKIIALLKPHGRAALVLPSGVFNNPNATMQKLREHVKKTCKIIAMIGIPHLAFQITGANNEGNLIFLEKMTPPADYPIFIDWASYIGIGSTGKKILNNDLNAILERMKKPPPENQIKFSELEDRIDPWYYHPRYRAIREHLLKSPYPLVPISEVVDESEDYFDPKKHAVTDIFNYIETNDVDLDEGVIISSRQINSINAPGRAQYVLKEGDFLIPDARDCIRGVTVITKDYEGWIGSNRFLVVRPKKAKVLSSYLYHILRQPEILALLKQQATGEINPGLREDALDRVKIPVPSDLSVQQEIVKQIEEEETAKSKILKELEQREGAISKLIRGGLPPLEMSRERMRKLGYDFIADL